MRCVYRDIAGCKSLSIESTFSELPSKVTDEQLTMRRLRGRSSAQKIRNTPLNFSKDSWSNWATYLNGFIMQQQIKTIANKIHYIIPSVLSVYAISCLHPHSVLSNFICKHEKYSHDRTICAR